MLVYVKDYTVHSEGKLLEKKACGRCFAREYTNTRKRLRFNCGLCQRITIVQR